MDRCLPYCLDRVTVEDFYGSYQTSCTTMKGKKFNHPMMIKTGGCEEVVWGRHPCDGMNHYCNNHLLGIALGITLGLFIASFMCLIWLRYYFLKRAIHKENMTMQISREGLLARSGSTTALRRSLCYLFVYLLLGIELIESCLIKLPNGNLESAPGGVVCTLRGNVTIPIIKNQIMLSKLYETGDWIYSNDFTWGCAGGSCPTLTECESTHESVSSKKGGLKWSKLDCVSIVGGCAFGRGCLYGNHTIQMEELFSVYSIASINSNHYEYLSVGDCTFSLSKPGQMLVGNNAIVSGGSSAWLCSGHSLPMSPKLNTLGDVQVMGNKMLFDWKAIECGANWYQSQCSTPGSFVSRLNTLCTPLPDFTSWGYMYHTGGSFYISEYGSYTVGVNCKENNYVIESTACNISKMELWGVRNHDSGLYIALVASSMQENQTTLIKHPCNDNMITINCNSKLTFLPISEEERVKCANISDKTMDGSQYYVIKYHNEPEFTAKSSLISMSSFGLGIVGSIGGTWVIWIIIVLLVIKK